MQPTGRASSADSVVERDARRAALAGLVDDAGLFPPAEMSMERAVASHVTSKRGPEGWIMGLFVCPIARVGDFYAYARPADGIEWRLSLVAGAPGASWPDLVVDEVGAAADTGPPAEVRIELVETRVPGDRLEEGLEADLAFVLKGASGLPGAPPVYFEIPLSAGSGIVLAALDALAGAAANAPGRVGAKVRCGGFRTEDFPALEALAAFVVGCAQRGLPFKATQGLHQAFRHVEESSGFVRHGFVNILAATIFGLQERMDEGAAARILDERDPAAFRLTPRGFWWRDLGAAAEAVDAGRALFHSYGSCDFSEPVEALRAAGFIPPGHG